MPVAVLTMNASAIVRYTTPSDDNTSFANSTALPMAHLAIGPDKSDDCHG